MLNIILFGPPGSGKGTQAEKLVDKYELVHISTGDLFRYELGNETELGKKAKEYMSKGELVPDEITVQMLKNKVEKHPEAKGFIFDGFPRTVPQAKALDNLLREKNESVSALISLDVEEQEIINRILERGKTSGRSDDTDEDIIRKRIEVYREETTPVQKYYAEENKTIMVNGMGTIDEVFTRICREIDALQ